MPKGAPPLNIGHINLLETHYYDEIPCASTRQSKASQCAMLNLSQCIEIDICDPSCK